MLNEPKRIYVAGPLFGHFHRIALEELGLALTELGFEIYLPHRDSGIREWQGPPHLDDDLMRTIFEVDMEALRSSDIVVAWLDGSPDTDAGTAAEVGMAYLLDKPVYGILTDWRPWLNPIVWGICGKGAFIARSLLELRAILLNSALV